MRADSCPVRTETVPVTLEGLAALPVQIELGVGERHVGGAPEHPQGDVPGGASRVGEQFKKGTPGLLYFFLQCLLRQKHSVF